MSYIISKIKGEYVVVESDHKDAYETLEETEVAIERVKKAADLPYNSSPNLVDKSQSHVKEGRNKANKKLTKELKRGR